MPASIRVAPLQEASLLESTGQEAAAMVDRAASAVRPQAVMAAALEAGA